ncbi:hypothetical protein ACIQ9P_03955 [Kitasatospora sp. NPDC094019]|uniref:hypothetical protein n=1 Tax=Kitasatospora sp. NPDC094019 TaxID=3364091 RepID=UPI0038300EE9
MFEPPDDTVLDLDLDALFGDRGQRRAQTEAQVTAALADHGLTVHLIVLCHGTDTTRFATTARLCRALAGLLHAPGVDLSVSYQDGPAPGDLAAQLDDRVQLLDGHRPLTDPGTGAVLPATGKTEHLLTCLHRLLADGGDAARRYVVFLDSDYLLYDADNAFALYAPWALGFGGERCADPGFTGVEFSKGGSLRLAVAPDIAKQALVGERTWRFLDLLDAALTRTVPQAPPVSEVLPTGQPPTRTGLLDALGQTGFAELEAAVEQVTKNGGRSSRALSQWLSSRSEYVVDRWLARFSHLLHGDQGATLAAWTQMELAPGYGLEVSFLLNALFRPGPHRGRIVNALGLPHAHLPKDEPDNFALGVELFALVQRLRQGMTSRTTAIGPRQSPTKLGYKPVLLAPVPHAAPALYPPAATLTTGGTR